MSKAFKAAVSKLSSKQHINEARRLALNFILG